MLQPMTRPRGGPMTNERDWMTATEVEAMLNTELTRPRRSRLLVRLEELGIRIDRPSNRLTLVNRSDLLAFLRDIEAGRRERPDWLP